MRLRGLRFRDDKGLRVRAKRKQATWHVTRARSFNSTLKEQTLTGAVNQRLLFNHTNTMYTSIFFASITRTFST